MSYLPALLLALFSISCLACYNCKTHKYTSNEPKLVKIELSKKKVSDLELQSKIKDSPLLNKGVKPLRLYGTSSVAMSNFDNYQYVGEIEIGSEGLRFQVIFDTGSAWTWVASYLCNSCKDTGIKSFYRCFTSNTCKVTQINIQKDYGKGRVIGRLVADKVKIGSLEVNEQEFTLITEMQDLKGLKFDGLVGLGFKTLSNNSPTILDNFKSKKLISKVAFSIYYNDDEDPTAYKSALIIGGYDSNLMHKNDTVHYCKVISNLYWNVQLQSIKFSAKNKNVTMKKEPGSRNLMSDSALIDSGTSLILFPRDDFNTILNILKTYEQRCFLNSNIQQIICYSNDLSNYPTIYFNLCGKELAFLPQDYTSLLGKNKDGLNQYLVCFSSLDLKSAPTLAILGASFMKEYYTLFNQDDLQIGFIKAARFGPHLSANLLIMAFVLLVLIFTQKD